jgi:hypothetical protein
MSPSWFKRGWQARLRDKRAPVSDTFLGTAAPECEAVAPKVPATSALPLERFRNLVPRRMALHRWHTYVVLQMQH